MEVRKTMFSICNKVRNALVEQLEKNGNVATGELKDNIVVKAEGTTLIITMPIQGKYLEFGTKPHIIRAKPGKVLAFAKAGGMRVKHNNGNVSTKFSFGGKTVMDDAVFAKQVHHPGTQPSPFIRPVIHQQLGDIISRSIR